MRGRCSQSTLAPTPWAGPQAQFPANSAGDRAAESRDPHPGNQGGSLAPAKTMPVRAVLASPIPAVAQPDVSVGLQLLHTRQWGTPNSKETANNSSQCQSAVANRGTGTARLAPRAGAPWEQREHEQQPQPQELPSPHLQQRPCDPSLLGAFWASPARTSAQSCMPRRVGPSMAAHAPQQSAAGTGGAGFGDLGISAPPPAGAALGSVRPPRKGRGSGPTAPQ